MTRKHKTSKVINIIIWIAQVLLSLTFIWAGFMKIFQPEKLPFPWVKNNANLVLVAGIVDLLAGVGILFPSLLRIKPKLTIYAAYGIIVLMLAACVFHISRGEAKDIGFNVFMALIATFIVWGRQKKAMITSK